MAEAPKGRGVGEQGQRMLREARAAVSANGLRMSGLQAQESRGEEDRGKAVEAIMFRLRPLA
jgi:hypothetical protein